MRIWEESVEPFQRGSQQWMSRREIIAIHHFNPARNAASVGTTVGSRCLNGRGEDSYPGVSYLSNPLPITEDPRKRGKHYRLLDDDERAVPPAAPARLARLRI